MRVFWIARFSTPVVAFLAALTVLVPALPAAADSPIGVIKTLEGGAEIRRGPDTMLPAMLGKSINLYDEIRTGPDGTVGVTLDDETLVSLGPNSVVVIDEMIYQPAKGDAGLSMHLFEGTLSYVSGGIAKMRPGSVLLTTPSATIGIRGTHLALRAPAR